MAASHAQGGEGARPAAAGRAACPAVYQCAGCAVGRLTQPGGGPTSYQIHAAARLTSNTENTHSGWPVLGIIRIILYCFNTCI